MEVMAYDLVVHTGPGLQLLYYHWLRNQYLDSGDNNSKRTKITDIIEYILKQKWRRAGHIARTKDNRRTKRYTEWQPRRGKRSRGRPSRR